MTDIAPVSNHGSVADALARFLANSYALALKTQNYHWNVEGPSFTQLHTLFEEQYQDLADAVDVVAERIRALGAPAPGSFAEFEELSDLAPPLRQASENERLSDLLAGQRGAAASARAVVDAAREADDAATEDLAIGRIAAHDKAAWMLSSLLGGR